MGLDPFVRAAAVALIASAGPGLVLYGSGWRGPSPSAFQASEVCAATGLVPPSAPAGPDRETYDPGRGADPAVPLGVGHLRSTESFDWNWFESVTLPLFDEPGSTPSSWLVSGWVVPQDGEPRRLHSSRLVETGYEIPSLVVHEIRSPGAANEWVRLGVGRGPNDTAWTPACALVTPAQTLRVERWESLFTSGEISPLYFRREVRHALRTEPGSDADLLRWIPAGRAYALHPTEVRGDWMRVALAEPSDYCLGPDEASAARVEGWVRWRDETGPWVWYYTRGC